MGIMSLHQLGKTGVAVEVNAIKYIESEEEEKEFLMTVHLFPSPASQTASPLMGLKQEQDVLHIRFSSKEDLFKALESLVLASKRPQ
jgi:hypothetical protein